MDYRDNRLYNKFREARIKKCRFNLLKLNVEQKPNIKGVNDHSDKRYFFREIVRKNSSLKNTKKKMLDNIVCQ